MPFYFKTGPDLFVLFCHLGPWRLFIMHRISVVSDDIIVENALTCICT